MLLSKPHQSFRIAWKWATQRNEKTEGWERGFVVDAALTSVISAGIETRCGDGLTRSGRQEEEEEVKGAALKVDEGVEITICSSGVTRLNAIHISPEKRGRWRERDHATPRKSAHFSALIMLKFLEHETLDPLKTWCHTSQQFTCFFSYSFSFLPFLYTPSLLSFFVPFFPSGSCTTPFFKRQ